jgi:hypothetical protein
VAMTRGCGAAEGWQRREIRSHRGAHGRCTPCPDSGEHVYEPVGGFLVWEAAWVGDVGRSNVLGRGRSGAAHRTASRRPASLTLSYSLFFRVMQASLSSIPYCPCRPLCVPG